MSEPVNRRKNMRVIVDFSHCWKVLDEAPITEEDKRLLCLHIIESLELNPSAIMSKVIQKPSPNSVVAKVDLNTLNALAMSIYELMVYHNLFVWEVPDNSNGLVVEFPYGALHVTETALVLIGDGQPAVQMLPTTPSMLSELQALDRGIMNSTFPREFLEQ